MDLTKTTVCPKCGHVVMVTDQFCSQCGERLDRPSFWKRLGAWFQSAARPGPRTVGQRTIVLKKNVTLQSIDKQSVKHVYHSLDEVPPEFRAEFEKLTKELDARPQSESSAVSNETQQPQQETVIRENFQEYRFKDETGKEQIYHSLDEMPPETRALFEKLRGQIDLPE